MERALEAAARRGARVVVRLEAHPYRGAAGLARANQRTAERLRAAGADASCVHPLHAKEIQADDSLFLDGRNWNESDFVIRDDDRSDLATTKRAALESEASLLSSATQSDRVLVESESFGSGNPVYVALDALAYRCAAPRLLVSARDLREEPRERAILQHLQRDGVDVRICDNSEKFALTGERAWIGSANATYDGFSKDMPDWGLCTDSADVVSAARERLERRWHAARPLR